jgi:uncharacterized LabA/DUF88 family protein
MHMLTSVAVFVDAGYLFAQGSTAICGANLPRSQLKLNSAAAAIELKGIALAKSDGCRLLRIYWYDGSSSGRLSLDHAALAHSDDIKLRLGQINSVGEQKGVDSLIVTDLIELARNRAVSDVLLMSGDEDVRIGVQIAQSFGVRVHLIGIEAGKSSQSPLLLQEADTTSLWTKTEVEKFLSGKEKSTPVTPQSHVKAKPANFDQVATELANTLDNEQIASFEAFRKSNVGIPSEFDGRLLAKARDQIQRDLTQSEKKSLRAKFVEAIRSRNAKAKEANPLIADKAKLESAPQKRVALISRTKQ